MNKIMDFIKNNYLGTNIVAPTAEGLKISNKTSHKLLSGTQCQCNCSCDSPGSY